MSPDDPRHGTHAGFIAHWRTDREPCDECREAERRYNKRLAYRLAHGVRNRIPLGKDAWERLIGTNLYAVERATGLSYSRLCNYRTSGPETQVCRSTRDAILGATLGPTVIGLSRRVQALRAIGYSPAELSRRYGGTRDSWSITSRRTERKYLRQVYTDRVTRAYDELHLTPGPSAREINQAARIGWAPPLAWDDIDDIDEEPKGLGARDATQVDEVAIHRRLEGDRSVRLNAVEQLEAVRLWEASGKPLNEMERLTGINTRRVLRDAREAA